MSFWNKIEKPASEPPPVPAQSPRAPAQPPRADPLPAPAAPSAERLAPPLPPPAPREEPAAPPRGNHLRLGRGVRLEGKLTFSGTVRIDATFQGSIVADGVLVVGEDAKVDADITCASVVIEGEVNGNVVAREAVELRRTATVRGDVETPSLAVERGAVFEGASRRPAATWSPSAGKAAAAPAPTAH
jgi:cytoskeletal protein CcmA (bactofilin family)